MRVAKSALVLVLALAVIAVGPTAGQAAGGTSFGGTSLRPADGNGYGGGGGGILTPEWRRFYINFRFFGWLSDYYPDRAARMRPSSGGFVSQPQGAALPGRIGAGSRLFR